MIRRVCRRSVVQLCFFEDLKLENLDEISLQVGDC